MKVKCYCSECEGKRPQVTMTTFESHGGRFSKKPKQSIRVRKRSRGPDTAISSHGQYCCISIYSLLMSGYESQFALGVLRLTGGQVGLV
jgi:hypothetical protein